MSVARFDLNSCIGCGTCAAICPLDVFYMQPDAGKSIIAYPENCQSCGQCYLHCPTNSLMMTFNTYKYAMNSSQGLKTWTELMPAQEA